jgi:hypothetical protein
MLYLSYISLPLIPRGMNKFWIHDFFEFLIVYMFPLNKALIVYRINNCVVNTPPAPNALVDDRAIPSKLTLSDVHLDHFSLAEIPLQSWGNHGIK